LNVDIFHTWHFRSVCGVRFVSPWRSPAGGGTLLRSDDGALVVAGSATRWVQSAKRLDAGFAHQLGAALEEEPRDRSG